MKKRLKKVTDGVPVYKLQVTQDELLGIVKTIGNTSHTERVDEGVSVNESNAVSEFYSDVVGLLIGLGIKWD